MNSADSLELIRADINNCAKCTETHSDLFLAHRVGTVSRDSQDVFIIAERPGQRAVYNLAPTDAEYEQLQQQSGIGRFIEDLGLTFERVYFSNIVKCAALGQRDADIAELHNCRSFLFRQIAIKSPRVLIACGNPTLEGLTGELHRTGKNAGQIIDWTHPRTEQVFKMIISPNPTGTYFNVHRDRVLCAVQTALWSILTPSSST